MDSIMEYIEAKRVAKAVKKQDIAGYAGISPDYYTRLVKAENQPSWPVVLKFLERLDLQMVVTEKSAIFVAK